VIDLKTLAYSLAVKAKQLTADMQTRCNRSPDTADYAAAFEAILLMHRTPADPHALSSTPTLPASAAHSLESSKRQQRILTP
jgi:hypothetical protein